MRTHPLWFTWVRNRVFVWVSLFVIVAYAIFLLPVPGVTPPGLYNTSLVVFIVLVLAWCANILSDRDQPELIKGIVAFALVGVMAWLFYRFSGAEWERLQKSFFAWERMEGNWWILFDGLRVTLMLAAISAVFSVLVGLVVAILRFYDHPTLNIFLIAYIDVFRSVPMIVIMVVLFFALP